ncbi:MAG: hypothetical protein WC614_13160 [bacterium]
MVDSLTVRFEYPFHNFLTYLILRQTTVEEIKSRIKALCHATLTAEDVEAYRQRFYNGIDKELPNALQNAAGLSKEVLSKAMEKYNLMDMYEFESGKNNDMETAYKLATTDDSLVLNILSLKQLKPAEITELYESCYPSAKKISTKVLELYFHYFWDISTMDTADWSHLLPKLENEDYYRMAIKSELKFILEMLGIDYQKINIQKFVENKFKYKLTTMGPEEASIEHSGFLKQDKFASYFDEDSPHYIPGYPESEATVIEENAELGKEY